MGTTAALSITAPGTFTVTVTNASGCTYTESITISQVPGISSVSISAEPISSLGGTTKLTVTVTGGTAPYQYKLNNERSNQKGSSFTVGAGTYTVYVKDANGCVGSSEEITIVKPTLSQTSLAFSMSSYTAIYGSVYVLSAVLKESNNIGVSNKTITFIIGTQSITATTNATGTASAILTINQAPGDYTINAYFAGDDNYLVSNAVPRSLTISPSSVTAGLTGTVTKPRDGNKVATLATDNYTLTGVISGDNVSLNNPLTGTYNNANAGTKKLVTVTGLALSGAEANCYILTSTTASAKIGVITLNNTSRNKSASLISNIQTFTSSELKAYPNPSEGLPVTMEFVLNVSAKAPLDIMTVSGARVARLFEGDMEAGVMQTAVFDRWVTEGIYVYVLRWNDQMITGKVIITK